MIRVATGGQDFLFALGLWTSAPRYRDFPAKTIGWRLVPAFRNQRLLMLSKDNKTVGFCTYGWMTAAEYDTRRYSGGEVFARSHGERLVAADIIATGHVIPLCKELGRFFRARYGVSRVYSHRGPRNGVYCV